MYDKIKLYILTAIAAVVPLIMRVKVVPFKGLEKGQTNIYMLASGPKISMFHYYKAVFLWVMAGALLFIILGQLIDKKNRIKKDYKVFVSLGIFAFFTIISTVLSEFKYVSIWGFYDRTEGLITYMAYMVVFFAAYSIDFSKINLKPFKWGLVVSTVLLSLIGIGQFYGHNLLETDFAYMVAIPEELMARMPELTFRFKTKAYATLFNPNYVGSFAALVIPVFLGLFLFENGKRKGIVYFVTAVLTFSFLVASRSSAGLVGSFSASALLVAANFKNFKRDWKKYASIIVAFAIILSIMKFPDLESVFEKVNSRFSLVGVAVAQEIDNASQMAEGGSPDAASETEKNGVYFVDEDAAENGGTVVFGEGFTAWGTGRGYIWYKSLLMMRDTIILGNGPDTYIFYVPHSESFEEGFNKVIDKPHNTYLQIGINQGLVALIAFIFLNMYAFRKFFKQLDPGFSKRSDQVLLGLFAGLFGYLVTSLFNDSVVSVAPIYWTMLGISLSILARAKEMEKAKTFDM